MPILKASERTVQLMLDSGIFSAWSRNEQLDLKEYIEYLKRHEHHLFSYVNMDVIPGKFGRERTLAEVAASAKGSYDNLQRMKDAGLHPIPVFHQEESLDWLVKMLHDGERYIGISSSKDLWARQQRAWLDKIFTLLTDRQGRPLVRVHGFGITNPKLLFRYPWYSVDSTTWSLTPGYGQIVVPAWHNEELNYTMPPTRVIVSGITHKMKGAQKRQFDDFGDGHEDSEYQAAVIRFVTKECGMTMADIRYQGNARRKAMLIYYLRLMDHLHDVRFNHRHAGLLTSEHELPKLKPVSVDRLHIMFATHASTNWSYLMTDVGANTRLLSYYETRKLSTKNLLHYIRTGLSSAREIQARPPKSSKELAKRWRTEAFLNRRRAAVAAKERRAE